MISKKLLSEVTGDKVIRIDDIPNEYSNNLIYTQMNNPKSYTESININELTYRIKEWLHKRGVVTRTIYYGKDNVTVGWAGTEEYYTDQSEFEGCVKLATKIQRDKFKQ